MAKRVSDRRFAETKHRYTDPRTGERVTGVTAIVGCFDQGDKLGAGAYAAYNLAKEGKFFRDEWDAKRDLGTRVHGYAELWMNGRQAEILDTDQPYADAFRRFCDDNEPEWIEVERPVVSSLGFGGRFDMVGAIRDFFLLADIKTGRRYPVDLSMQLAGYRFADGMILYDDDGWAVDIEPMPHIDKCAGLYLNDDTTYDLVEVPADTADLDALVNLLAVKNHAAARAKELKQTDNQQQEDAA